MHSSNLLKNKVLKSLFLIGRSLLLSVVIVASLSRIPIPGAWAASVSWIGGTDSNWSTASNWSNATIPTADDDVLIDVSATINLASATTVRSIVLGNSSGTTTPILNFNYDSITNGALTVMGGNVHIYSGAKIAHTVGNSAVVGTMNINITAGDLIVDSGGLIDVNGLGYAQNSGSGSGISRSGAGYGATGGIADGVSTSGAVYGSITNPVHLGSGGGSGNETGGGNGGGAILLSVSGTVTNNGIIKTNGNDGSGTAHWSASGSGGGSGGSVNITCNTFTGGGTISANGGNAGGGGSGMGGGGSGGRIAINYSTKSYSGTLEAKGGTSSGAGYDGGPGSILTKASGSNGDLVYDDTGTLSSIYRKGYAKITSAETFDSLTIRNLANIELSSAITITGDISLATNSILRTTSSLNLISSTFTWTSGTIFDNGGTMSLLANNANITIPQGCTYISNASRTFNNININGTISSPTNSTSEVYKVNLIANGDMTISSTGLIDVTGLGYSATYGPGAGGSYSGGGHGGNGGIGEGGGAGGVAYDSIKNPQQMGSGGGNGNRQVGGNGGGIILLSVAGTFTNNGNIRSNGTGGVTDGYWSASGTGGGAGGGINVTCSTFAGSGTISSNGGTSGAGGGTGDGGGGSGGRIAINYTSKTYTGVLEAKGGIAGASGNDGAAGSIFTKASGTNGDLVFDNTGTTSSDYDKGYSKITTTETFDTITLRNLANVEITSAVTVTGTFSMASNMVFKTNETMNLAYSTLSWISGKVIDNGGSMALLANNADLTIPQNCTYISNTSRTFNNININGTLSSLKNSTSELYKVNLVANGDITISSTGLIDVNGLGYINGYGSGTNGSSNGAGYGGLGGSGSGSTTSGPTYGSISNPTNIGSGGGNGNESIGGYGGGAILISAGGSLTNNGIIRANGTDGAGNGHWSATGTGGGSGGSVNIVCNSFAGSGTISVNGGKGGSGGSGIGGGGGGGRIAIITSSNSYSGTLSTAGGTGNVAGGIGTVYPDTLTISNVSATNILEHSATISTELTTVPINGVSDTGFIWGEDTYFLTARPILTYFLTNDSGTSVLKDSSSSYDGTKIGTTTAEGIVGSGALLMNGTSDYVSVPVAATTGLKTFTISYWIKTTESRSSGTFWQRPSMFGNSTDGGASCDFGITTNAGYLGMWSGLYSGGDNSVISNVLINDNQWHYITVTADGSTLKLYSDGVYTGSSLPANLAFTAIGNYIGAQHYLNSSVNFYHQGIYDDFLIFDKTLSANQISTLYNSGNGLASYKTSNFISKGTTSSPITIASNLTALLPGTTYYFKPYATTSAGATIYGDLQSFATSGQSMALNSVTNLSNISATISSNTASIYNSDATDQGFIWSSDSQLSIPPIHAYYLNETEGSTVIDSFGNLNGTATGTSIVQGNTGNARSFNGTSEYITLPNSTDLDFGSNDFTISTWVYFTNVSKGYQMIIDRRANSDQTGWLLYLESNNALSFLSASSGGWNNTVLTSTGVVPTVNTWSNIVVTRRGSTFEMYLNGVLVKAGTFTGAIGAQTVNPTIGINHASPGSGVQGKIDNVQIYNKGLTSGEVQSSYNNGNGLENIYTVSKISKGSTSNTTGTFLTTDLSTLNPLTTYYFKPYIFYNGIYYYGDITSFTTLADNFIPSASKDNITGVADIYAGKTLDIVTRYSDTDGIADLDKLYLQIKNPAGTNIEYYANASESNQTGQTPTSVSGSEYISNITYDLSVNSPDTNDITVTWHLTPNWNWTRSTSIQYGIKALDKKAAESTYDYTVTTYKYENRLTFTGALTATDLHGNPLNSGDWTKANSTVNFTGLRVVYAGTTDVYPNDIDFDARVTNSEASFWDDYTSVGRDISINATTVDATNSSDTYTFSIPEIPNGGQDVSNVTFIIKTDKTSPIISSLTSSTHPNSDTWYTNTSATISWVAADSQSGIYQVWRLLDKQQTQTNSNIITNGTEDTASNSLSTTLTSDGSWYFHLLVIDNQGLNTSETYKINIDTQNPTIVSVTSSTHPDQTLWYTTKAATVTWETSDTGSDVEGMWKLIDQTNTQTVNEVLNANIKSSANATWTTPELENGIWYLHLVAKDNTEKTESITYTLKIDSSTPDITEVTGLYNNVWQNVEAGPVISWTDPSSTSDDTFYITNDGTIPTSTNYTYTTTTNTYDLPAQKEGETTINVRAMNGVGSYSTTKSYILKYDITAPTNISGLTATSSTKSITLSWSNPSQNDFSKVVIMRNSHIPLSIFDGTKVYEGNLTTFLNSNLSEGTKYYYTVFSFDTVGNMSSGAMTQATTLVTPPTPPAIVETPVVVNPPVVKDTTITQVQDLVQSQQPVITVDQQPATTTDSGNLHVYTDQTVTIEIPSSAVTQDVQSIKEVILVIQNQSYLMSYDAQKDTYKATVSTPKVKGVYDTTIEATTQDNSKSQTITMSIMVDPYGYIYTKEGDNQTRIANAKVSLYTKINNVESLWVSASETENPQYSSDTGEYQFFVQPGEYKIVVEADGYITTETEWFMVENNIIEKNIEIKKTQSLLFYGIIAGACLVTSLSVVIVIKKGNNRRKTIPLN